ncbi:MAG: site-specific integrase, partial [Bacteroidales bacterium]|nr:site-specific integrase [Bacteroidales bacterium]
MESELFLEMSQNGSRKRLATRLYIKPEQWDKHKQQVVRHPLSEEYNYYLMQYRLRFEQREMYLWRLGKEPSIEEVIKSDGVVSSQRSKRFLQYAQHCLEDSLWKESTKQNRRVTLSYWEKKMGDTSFFDIEERDIKRFLRYLKEDKLLSTNTIAKHLRHLKIFANMAVRDDLWPRKENPFERIHIKIENSPRPHLEQSELIKLESLASKERLPWLDAFLFCVYSGLRYSDFISLSDSNLHYENTGACWLSLRMKKTAHYLRLPLHALF